MESIYDRIEKIRLQFMKIMPRMKPKMMFGDVDNPIANLTISEVKILHLFKGNDRYKMSELAKACGMPLPTATHVVDKLVKNNIVKRTPDEKDRRVIFIEFTEQGRKVMAVCDVQHKENVKNMISILDKQDQERLISALENFAFVIEEISDKMDNKRKEKEGGK